MSDIAIELLAYHWAGGLLLGAYRCPDHVPNAVADERLRRVVEAIIAVAAVDGAWPVDVGRVVDTLVALGVYDEIGGLPLLLDLMETWSERVTRARVLGELEAAARIALVHLRAELRAEDEMVEAIARRARARECSADAIAAFEAASEAA
jgi:hypothetical protein